MVELGKALEPVEVEPPLPVDAVAERARRRRRHRRMRMAGLAVTVAAVVTSAVTSLRSYDDADRITTEPAAGVTGIHSPSDPPAAATSTLPLDDGRTDSERAPAGDAGPVVVTPNPTPPSAKGDRPSTETAVDRITPVGNTPGVTTSLITTSAWEDGRCLRVEVVNDGDKTVTWQVVLGLDGSIASLWSASIVDELGDDRVFVGEEGFNATLDAGAITSFGLCLHTKPS